MTGQHSVSRRMTIATSITSVYCVLSESMTQMRLGSIACDRSCCAHMTRSTELTLAGVSSSLAHPSHARAAQRRSNEQVKLDQIRIRSGFTLSFHRNTLRMRVTRTTSTTVPGTSAISTPGTCIRFRIGRPVIGQSPPRSVVVNTRSLTLIELVEARRVTCVSTPTCVVMAPGGRTLSQAPT